VPVAAVDDSIRTLIDDMLETMYAAPGVGLAATQVNVHKRVLVADITREQNSRSLSSIPRSSSGRARPRPRKAACPCLASSTS